MIPEDHAFSDVDGIEDVVPSSDRVEALPDEEDPSESGSRVEAGPDDERQEQG